MADYSVTLDSTPEYVVTQEKTVVAEFLSQLSDVNVPDLANKGNHVLIYNATAQKYELVPADAVLTSKLPMPNFQIHLSLNLLLSWMMKLM